MTSLETAAMNETSSGKSHVAAVLSSAELRLMDAYWRASNYLSVGQIYLLDIRYCGNP